MLKRFALSFLILSLTGLATALADPSEGIQKPRLVVQSGAGSWAGYGTVSISQDGRLIMSHLGGKSALWQAKTGRLLCVLSEELKGGTFSADGRSFLSQDGRGTDLRVWNLADCGTSKPVELHHTGADPVPVRGAKLHTLQDGRILVNAGQSGIGIGTLFDRTLDIKRLDVEQKCVYRNKNWADEDGLLGHSTDGDVLLLRAQFELPDKESTPDAGRAAYRVYDGRTQQLTTLLHTTRPSANLVGAVSPSGRWAAIASEDTLFLWDRITNRTHKLELGASTSYAGGFGFDDNSDPQAKCDRWKKRDGTFLKDQIKHGGTSLETYNNAYIANCGDPRTLSVCNPDRYPLFNDAHVKGAERWLRFSADEQSVLVWGAHRNKHDMTGEKSGVGVHMFSLRNVSNVKFFPFREFYAPEYSQLLQAGGLTNQNAADGKSVSAFILGAHLATLELRKGKPSFKIWSPGMASIRSAFHFYGADKIFSASVKADHVTNTTIGDQGPAAVVKGQRFEVRKVPLIISGWDLKAGDFKARIMGEYAAPNILPNTSVAVMHVANIDDPKLGHGVAPQFRLDYLDLETGQPLGSYPWPYFPNKAPFPGNIKIADGKLGSLVDSKIYPQEKLCRKLSADELVGPDGRWSGTSDKVIANLENWVLELVDMETQETIGTKNVLLRSRQKFKYSFKDGTHCSSPSGVSVKVSADRKRIVVMTNLEGVVLDQQDGRLKEVARIENVPTISTVLSGPKLRFVGGFREESPPVFLLPDRKTKVDFQFITGFRDEYTGTEAFSFSIVDDGLLVRKLRKLDDVANKFVTIKDLAEEEFVLSESRAFPIRSFATSEDYRFVVTQSADGSNVIWDLEKRTWLAKIYMFVDGTWAVIDPEGRFDTNKLEEVRNLHWVVPDDPFRALPIEIFMKEYYEPRLLAKILEGEKLAVVRDISKINRQQPLLRIAGIKASKSRPNAVNIGVQVQSVRGSNKQVSGVHDVRLFRNGRLVASKDGEIDVDPKTGKANLVFRSVVLPSLGEGEVEFSVYAFNSDRVKSSTVKRSYKYDLPSGSPKPKAYIISVGVNVYDNPNLNLDYAVNDANEMQKVLTERVKATGVYGDVIGVNLISNTGQAKATKENILAALYALSSSKDTGYSAAAASMSKAGPDDVVLFSFSGHGVAAENGEFYLLPSDTGAAADLADAASFSSRAISTSELERALRTIDAGDISVIIDACQSAASFDRPGFKPGPMGAKGLGQLAYDKGVRILAASQAQDAALEVEDLRHGLLTYALLKDGVGRGRADYQPRDERIHVDELLEFAVAQVPRVMSDITANSRGLSVQVSFDLERVSKATKRMQRQGHVIQQPKLFDFTKGNAAPYLIDLSVTGQ